ncbi:MAG: hypothetical protein OSB47_06480, partial [Pirellulaceae bacterium]|nr:hypothetical protein [Pirellulaceae bacterium]
REKNAVEKRTLSRKERCREKNAVDDRGLLKRDRIVDCSRNLPSVEAELKSSSRQVKKTANCEVYRQLRG